MPGQAISIWQDPSKTLMLDTRCADDGALGNNPVNSDAMRQARTGSWQPMCRKESRIPRRKPLILRGRLVQFSSCRKHSFLKRSVFESCLGSFRSRLSVYAGEAWSGRARRGIHLRRKFFQLLSYIKRLSCEREQCTSSVQVTRNAGACPVGLGNCKLRVCVSLICGHGP